MVFFVAAVIAMALGSPIPQDEQIIRNMVAQARRSDGRMTADDAANWPDCRRSQSTSLNLHSEYL